MAVRSPVTRSPYVESVALSNIPQKSSKSIEITKYPPAFFDISSIKVTIPYLLKLLQGVENMYYGQILGILGSKLHL